MPRSDLQINPCTTHSWAQGLVAIKHTFFSNGLNLYLSAGVRNDIEICASVFNSERVPYAIYERRGNVYQKVIFPAKGREVSQTLWALADRAEDGEVGVLRRVGRVPGRQRGPTVRILTPLTF